jgi:hypothetical protein
MFKLKTGGMDEVVSRSKRYHVSILSPFRLAAVGIMIII